MASVTGPTIDRLRLLVAWLGLNRRLGGAATDRRKEREREAVSLRSRLGPDVVRRVPGLLRDLAAEVGTEFTDILLDALQTLGLNAHADGSIPTALSELAVDVAEDRGVSTGMVADLARLERKGTSVAWEEIVSKPRGDTGHALSEVLTTFGDSAGKLSGAVAVDYQVEADAALLDESR